VGQFREEPANHRLQKALAILRDYREGRLPDIAKLVSSQSIGDSTKIPVEGDALYLIVQCYRTRSRDQGRFEAHQCYTDVQYICDGQECIEICDLRARLGALPTYDANGNVFFPLEPATRERVVLQAGEGVVLFPNDAHAACLRVESSEGQIVRKIVVKVKDAHLPGATGATR
jgi:YhcH/YjgK/YiaL family protein